MKKLKISVLLITLFFATKTMAQPAAPSPNHIWIEAHTVLRNGEQVTIPGHWERKRAGIAKDDVRANPDKPGEFFITEQHHDSPAANTDQQKADAINENNTTGSSSARVIRGGGSREKQGGVPKDKVETFCFKQEMNTNKVADKFGLIANRSEIYPGSVISGKNFINGNYEHVSRPLNPVKLYIPNVIFTDASKATKVIEQPDVATLSTSVLPMVNNTFEGKVQSDLQFESSEVLSRADMKLNCNIHADGFFITLDNAFSLSTSKYSTTIMLSFVQKYFTVAAQMPPADSIFKDGTKPDDDMMYIRSVTYGRRGILFITVDSAATTMIDTLKASYDAVVKHVSLSADFMKSNTFKNSKIAGYVYGGSAASASKIFNTDPQQCVDEFFKFLQEGAEFSKDNFGRPIEYEVAFLKTDELACIEYDIKEVRKVCDEGSQLLRVTLKSIKAIKNDDGGDDHTGEYYGVAGVYYELPDAPVRVPTDQRFYKKNETPELPFFDSERGGDRSKIILPGGGKISIPPDRNKLWAVKRSSYVRLSNGQTAPVNKSVDFLYKPGTSLDKLVFFVNIDEADSDDADDNMEGLVSSEEIKYIQVPRPGQQLTVTQQVRDTNPNGTLLELTYLVEYVPLH